ncbi:uncharacterized protein MELLADRAFT_89453 [Melampsora larici-populina 98AG31]|uniref:Uncharacterized protein n=1 Tax=Melampsora larici-populina (strain 98AG31 / pathotype 3-4-7) TaxID=747676 RepID=F4RTE8_MELLP|nr:uncharacterized protein MELLADRAFT_89453 [Melampsora larici-populina 98AG31]EGG04245.1 hypothetical protein MELLADRAFT_89453 [Melampsora larici-populina 98AG31]
MLNSGTENTPEQTGSATRAPSSTRERCGTGADAELPALIEDQSGLRRGRAT